jgi:hypothetical protein
MAEISPVNKKVPNIQPIIFPNLFAPFILAIEDEMVKKISGTIIVNNRFKKTSPIGCKITASSFMTKPIIAPSKIDSNSMIGKR